MQIDLLLATTSFKRMARIHSIAVRMERDIAANQIEEVKQAHELKSLESFRL